MAYTFDDTQGSTRKDRQYYEIHGHRGLWHEGWKAVTYHHPATLSPMTAGSCTTSKRISPNLRISPTSILTSWVSWLPSGGSKPVPTPSCPSKSAR